MRTGITFGTFDLLHIGHISILERSRALCDRLVVGVSTDALNIAKKGIAPVYSQEERLKIVSALRCVDEAFYEESLEKKADYIRQFRADVLVMGDDWAGRFDHPGKGRDLLEEMTPVDPAQLADLDVTVIVPMHNRAATIGRALESIARQTRRPARVLVVDDASRDGSVAAARQVPLANLEILELKQNRGPGGARNAGVAAAKTRWVAFLDSDDSWAPTFLEEVVGAAEALNADFASSGGIRELIRRPPVQRVIDAPPEGADRTTDFWRIARRFTPIVPSSAVISRSLYLRAGGFDEDVHWGEDVTLFARLWLEGRFVFVNRPLYTSAQLPGGMSAVNRGYRETALHLARLGGTLVRAAARRKPGTRLFAREFARRVYRKHRHWLGGHIRKRILHS